MILFLEVVELFGGRVHPEEVDHRDGIGLGDIAQFTSCPIYVLSSEVVEVRISLHSCQHGAPACCCSSPTTMVACDTPP